MEADSYIVDVDDVVSPEMDRAVVFGDQYIQVGLRGYYPDAASFEKMRNYGFRYYTMARVERDSSGGPLWLSLGSFWSWLPCCWSWLSSPEFC